MRSQWWRGGSTWRGRWCVTGVCDWRDRARRGALTAGVLGPKGSVKLTEADDQLMRERVAQQPGITALQLIPSLSVEMAKCTVCRRLKRLELCLKESH